MRNKILAIVLAVVPAVLQAIGLPELPDREGADLKGYVHDGEKGVEGVLVTDGFTFTRTDATGAYYLASSPKAEFVYYTLPSGYAGATVEHSVAKFFEPIDRGAATFRADFELKPIGDDTSFSFLVHADTQPDEYYNTNVYTELNKSYRDMQAQAQAIAEADGFETFNLHLGDIILNTNNIVRDYTTYLGVLDVIGYNVPTYATPGNHDRRYVVDYNEATAVYRNVWGPVYHSFNRGKIHFVSLDNVKVAKAGDYTRGISAEATEWLKKDLSHLEKGSKVVLITHQPMTRGTAAPKAYKEVLDILAEYDVLILSGHLHRIFTNFPEYAPSIEERSHVALGGYTWRGPCAQDGTPPGYYIYHVEGDEISWKFKWTAKDPDTEMFYLYRPGQFDTPRYAAADEKTIYMNVWDWDSRWKVTYSADGEELGEVTRVSEDTFDPWALYCYDDVEGKEWNAAATYHLFHCTVPNTCAKLEVTATDRFGRSSSKSVALSHIAGIESVPASTSGVTRTELFNMQGVKVLETEGRPVPATLPLLPGCYVMRLHHTDGSLSIEKTVM